MLLGIEKQTYNWQRVGISAFNVDETNWNTITETISKNSRKAEYSRKTKETSIDVNVDLNSSKEAKISTGINFLITCLIKYPSMEVSISI